ncbi:hypothetical protein K466DRAFT_517314 [Polyporus arcularius HHB13444]|uniref:BIR-domain-containing protein n=1 Tax=Polyporus arcularius HHB13444 TaxID=1314778 RepID=A0A5C3PKR3_9APHY|nr:hypothetical protein K466DRAFT_517314 [Polyporus arcularius HHB13444]
MEYLQARVDSFSKSKRSKNSSVRHASSSSKWPHPSSFKATPDSLAEAGFYFDPDLDNPDNVTCFMCKKGVADWAPEDDPFSIHYDKCAKSCAWAMVRCQRGVGGESHDSSDPTRHPTSKAVEKARLETFSKVSWPHDAVKGHGANSKALAKAGFICNSTEPGDDTALCLYCNLTLSGWDEDDDPYDEHLKRDKKKGTSCAFLQAYAGNSLGKSTTKRPASKAAPKPPLRSASQSLRGAPASEVPDATVDSDDELAAIPSDASAPARPSSGRQRKASSARASSVTTKTPASRRSTRGTSTSGKTSGSRTVSSDLEETEGGSESDAGRRAGKSKRKTGGKTKARVSAIAEEDDETGAAVEAIDDDVVMQEPEPEPEAEPEQDPPKKKRGRPPKSAAAKPAAKAKGKKAAATEEEAEDPIVETHVEQARLPPTKKAHTRTRSKANVESEVEAAISSSKRTHTRTKSGPKTKVKQEENEEEPVGVAPLPKKKGKQAAVQAEEEEEEEPVFALPKKPKGRAVSRSKVKPELPVSDIDDVEPEQEEEGKSHSRADSGRSAASREAKPSHESKSSLSEDAGYATAEPPADADRMDIDERPPPSPPPKNVDAPVLSKPGPRARTVSRSTPANGDSGKRPSPATNGVRPSGVASSSRPSVARPASKLNKDSLQVIDIDSDGEETGVYGPPARATAKGKAPVSRAESMNSINAVKKPASQPSRKKLQVEVVAPPPPTRSTAMEVEVADVQMQDQSSTSPEPTQPARGASPSAVTEPQLRDPGTPVSAVHRSAHSSPIREADSRVPSSQADVLGAVSQSPQTYHPFLAQMPIEKLSSLTEEETEMTLEQYIRREMEIQYAQLKADGERRIDEFKRKAAETKRLIESS